MGEVKNSNTGLSYSSANGMKKAVVFYTYLPPWRIDVFNEMGRYYDLLLVFQNANAEGFTYNRDLLQKKLKVKSIFLESGFSIGNRVFRTGINSILRQFQPDIIFTHEYGPTSVWLAALVKSNWIDARLVVTTSDNLFMATTASRPKRAFRKFVLSASKRVVVYSEPVKQYYSKQFPWLEVEVCPNIQNPETLLTEAGGGTEICNQYRIDYRLDDNLVLFTGRLEYVKGLDLLIKAFAETISDTHQLILVGEGKQKPALEKMVKDLGLTGKVIFPGFFSGSELYAWYHMADFFVLPSRYEPFGAVVNEALVFGCPVLASKYIGALEYIQEDFNGLTFDPKNQIEFKSVLVKASASFKQNTDSVRPNLMIKSFEDYVTAFSIV
jgi:glycosyltransferase involved in cell wall biosynthesis